MPRAKIAITIDEGILGRLDRLVEEARFPNRSKAIEEALREALDRLDAGRFARECAKLDPAEEKAMAEEGMDVEAGNWPEY